MLTMLLDAKDEQGEGLSDTELRDELMTVLAAGHETTATALCWAFERILNHPDVEDRLRAELAGVAPRGHRRRSPPARVPRRDHQRGLAHATGDHHRRPQAHPTRQDP